MNLIDTRTILELIKKKQRKLKWRKCGQLWIECIETNFGIKQNYEAENKVS